MNPEQQKLALLEWAGYKRFHGSWVDKGGDYVNSNLSSLDTIAEFEGKLSANEHKLFREKLCVVCLGKNSPISATAQQRLEAMVRTLGLYEEKGS